MTSSVGTMIAVNVDFLKNSVAVRWYLYPIDIARAVRLLECGEWARIVASTFDVFHIPD